MGMTAPIEVCAIVSDELPNIPKVIIGKARSLTQAEAMCEHLGGFRVLRPGTHLTGKKGDTDRQWVVYVVKPSTQTKAR
jgi:hypothetical protein